MIAALALAGVAAISAPGAAAAQQAPALPFDPGVLQFIPALLGAAAEGPQEARDARSQLLLQLGALIAQPGNPPALQSRVTDIAEFVGGADAASPGAPQIPTDGPPISQFLYPTIGVNCIGPGQNSVASALAVAGPAKIPVPGPKAGEAAFVFTALGTAGSTGKLAPEPLTVAWLNLATMQGGQEPLNAKARINPDGPTTLSTIVRTGSGPVIASIQGNIENKGSNGAITCGFGPTVGLVIVP